MDLIGLSIDSLFSHLAWAQNIQEKLGVEISFRVIEGIKAEAVAKRASEGYNTTDWYYSTKSL